jgi:hypothetical protein
VSADRGFVTAWTVVLAVACWTLVGLVLDGGRTLRERSEAFGAAAAAARAGTQQIDEYAAVEGDLVIDADEAQAAAEDYLAARGFEGTVGVDDLDVTVTVTGTVDLQILPGTIGYTVRASSRAHRGAGPP